MLDFTTFWVFAQKHKYRSGQLLLALLIFAVGWQAGKVMSPYYAASPIIFEDRPCEGQASSGGTAAELQALQEEGRQQAARKTLGDDAAEPAAPAAVGKTPGVNEKTPGVEETAAPNPAVAGTSAPTSQKLFVGSVNSNLYHHKDCSTASRIKSENQLWFASTEEAEAAGYSPSQCTREKLGI